MTHDVARAATTTGAVDRPAGAAPLPAKLRVPAVPAIHLVRTRLESKLTAKPVTAVTGPAGYGKTTLVAGWARGTPAPDTVAWVTLDDADNDPAVFWNDVLTALRRTAPRGGPHIPIGPVGRPLLRRVAAGLAVLPGPVTLVLDRAESVANPAIAADLGLLMRESAPGLRLVIVGREARLLPLHGYRLADELAEIDADALALAPAETEKLLRAYQISLTPGDITSMHERTEGWITAVCMHAVTIRSGAGGFSGYPHPVAQEAIADYLRAEVLDPYPEPVRDVLLRTSIVDDVDDGLAEHLTGHDGGALTMRRLAAANAFVHRSGGSGFRYHSLFREVLHDTLAGSHPDLERGLHARAARWYAERRRLPEALRHAIRTGDRAFVTRTALRQVGVAWLITAPEAEPCRALLAGLPSGERGSAARLLRAALALARHDLDAAASGLAGLADRLPSAGIPVRLGAATVSVVLGRYTGDLAAVEAGVAQLDPLWDRIPAAMGAVAAQTRALAQSSLGAAQLWAGRLPEARISLGRAAASTEPGVEYLVHDALAHLAMLNLVDGKLNQADRYARESLGVAERAALSPPGLTAVAHTVLAAVALLRDDLPEVRQHTARARAVRNAGTARTDPFTTTLLGLLPVRAAGARWDGNRALAAIEAARAALDGRAQSPVIADRIRYGLVRAHLTIGGLGEARAEAELIGDPGYRALAVAGVLIAAGDPTQARRVLSGLSARTVRPHILVDAGLTLGRLAFDDGDLASAEQAVRDALEHARPELRRRPFTEAGDWVTSVLANSPALADRHTWLTPGREAATSTMEPLTPREIDVLGHLAQGLTMEDIATVLHLSVNTVKTHLKNIYRKLGVSARSGAMRRAREINLLPRSLPQPVPRG
jgi:LuxR family maltose regulon positive regulatory protein